jgi:hypothetical protein
VAGTCESTGCGRADLSLTIGQGEWRLWANPADDWM